MQCLLEDFTEEGMRIVTNGKLYAIVKYRWLFTRVMSKYTGNWHWIYSYFVKQNPSSVFFNDFKFAKKCYEEFCETPFFENYKDLGK